MSSNRLIPFCLFSAVVSAGEARGFVGFLPHSVFHFSRLTLFIPQSAFRNLQSLQFLMPLHLLTFSPNDLFADFSTHHSLLSTQHFSSACTP
jgi:hypothetical protein